MDLVEVFEDLLADDTVGHVEASVEELLEHPPRHPVPAPALLLLNTLSHTAQQTCQRCLTMFESCYHDPTVRQFEIRYRPSVYYYTGVCIGFQIPHYISLGGCLFVDPKKIIPTKRVLL